MKNHKEQLVACNICHSKLLEFQNKLSCSQCLKDFPLIEGVGVFVDLEKLPKHEINQIEYFENENENENEDAILYLSPTLESWQNERG